mgnify:CR=1 FL=1
MTTPTQEIIKDFDNTDLTMHQYHKSPGHEHHWEELDPKKVKSFLLSSLKKISEATLKAAEVEEKRLPFPNDPDLVNVAFRDGFNSALRQTKEKGREFMKQFEEL